MIPTLRRWLLKLSIPIQRLMQKLHLPEPLIKAKFYRQVEMDILYGDVLLSREKYHFTNMFIPGFWSHAAIYAGDVVESIGSGVQSVDLAEWLLTKDYVLVLRPTFLHDISDRWPVMERANAQIGKPYDFEFSSDVSAWYCSELVWYCLGSPVFEMRETLGVQTVVPQDFENAVRSGKFEVVADSR